MHWRPSPQAVGDEGPLKSTCWELCSILCFQMYVSAPWNVFSKAAMGCSRWHHPNGTSSFSLHVLSLFLIIVSWILLRWACLCNLGSPTPCMANFSNLNSLYCRGGCCAIMEIVLFLSHFCATFDPFWFLCWRPLLTPLMEPDLLRRPCRSQLILQTCSLFNCKYWLSPCGLPSPRVTAMNQLRKPLKRVSSVRIFLLRGSYTISAEGWGKRCSVSMSNKHIWWCWQTWCKRGQCMQRLAGWRVPGRKQWRKAHLPCW